MENLGPKLATGRDKFAILIETNQTRALILFLATREQTSQKGVIRFSIDKVITNINNSNVTHSDLSDKLKSINNDNIQSKLQQLSESDITRGTITATDKSRDGKQNKRQKYTGHGRVSKKPRFLSG